VKSLILAGGRGSRALEISSNNNKCMARVSGKCIIDASLDNAATYTDEIIIVIGYYGEQIRKHVGNRWKGVPVKYVFQETQKGLLDAMKYAESQIGESDFLLFLGDEILINSNHALMIDIYYQSNAFAVCGLVYEPNKERIKKTYCVHIHDGLINKLEEKPLQPETCWMGTGNCVFNSRIFEYINRLGASSDKSFPDILQAAINDGEKVYGTILCEKYFNINTKEDYLEYMEECL